MGTSSHRRRWPFAKVTSREDGQSQGLRGKQGSGDYAGTRLGPLKLRSQKQCRASRTQQHSGGPVRRHSKEAGRVVKAVDQESSTVLQKRLTSGVDIQTV